MPMLCGVPAPSARIPELVALSSLGPAMTSITLRSAKDSFFRSCGRGSCGPDDGKDGTRFSRGLPISGQREHHLETRDGLKNDQALSEVRRPLEMNGTWIAERRRLQKVAKKIAKRRARKIAKKNKDARKRAQKVIDTTTQTASRRTRSQTLAEAAERETRTRQEQQVSVHEGSAGPLDELAPVSCAPQ